MCCQTVCCKPNGHANWYFGTTGHRGFTDGRGMWHV
jgi:hypothetical protein